ncbi:MAG: hypothetical protein K2P81_01745 [Bacteriovoracaceae bacterium]|nr:hypothetical protein [Bacteriovoracaceae bacterium]
MAKWIFLFFICTSSYAQNLILDFEKDAQAWLDHQKSQSPLGMKLQERFNFYKMNADFLKRRILRLRHLKFPMIETQRLNEIHAPALALQASRFEVIEATDDWMKDDIYLYFFVTDGLVTSGKVTSIYKGLGAGESFFFNLQDRLLYPSGSVSSKDPQGHFIVDYGIVESDGDDIREMQKLSAIIVDLLAEIYASQEPQNGALVLKLRQEVKALADALLSRDDDDELVTSTWVLSQDVITHLENETFVDISRVHRHNNFFNKWKYRLTLRLLK